MTTINNSNKANINASDFVNNNANNIANAADLSRAVCLGFVEALTGSLVTAAGLKLRDISLTQSGVGCVRDGLGDVMSAMEAGQMDRAQIQRQDSRIATLVLYLYDLIWPYIEYYGHCFGSLPFDLVAR
jgi:hypothetical protein